MRVLLTGGAGDLGTVVTPLLEQRGDVPLRLDILPPRDERGVYRKGSILDRDCLARELESITCVVHIAAWHGIHESRGVRDANEFWDLNVTGTFNVFEAAARAGINKLIYISSTSIQHQHSLYSHTKVLGEEIARTYVARHGMSVIVLRPRAFIPHWNQAAYTSFVEWAKWFWTGAVHISDMAQAVVQSVDLLTNRALEELLVLTVDGAYEYTDDDLATWDQDGPGSTFRRYYAGYEELARQHGLKPEAKPSRYDISATAHHLGYVPHYSLRNLLDELQRFGLEGPPNDYW